MRYYDSDEIEEFKRNKIKLEDWKLDLIKLNAHYISWGCFEDYMYCSQGWAGKIILKTFDQMWSLNELNECINYYFDITDEGNLALQLWMMQPRKGCTRGIYIQNIRKKDLPKVKEFLLEARKRINNIFENVDLIKC